MQLHPRASSPPPERSRESRQLGLKSSLDAESTAASEITASEITGSEMTESDVAASDVTPACDAPRLTYWRRSVCVGDEKLHARSVQWNTRSLPDIAADGGRAGPNEGALGRGCRTSMSFSSGELESELPTRGGVDVTEKILTAFGDQLLLHLLQYPDLALAREVEMALDRSHAQIKRGRLVYHLTFSVLFADREEESRSEYVVIDYRSDTENFELGLYQEGEIKIDQRKLAAALQAFKSKFVPDTAL